jgi:hypothetical protein
MNEGSAEQAASLRGLKLISSNRRCLILRTSGQRIPLGAYAEVPVHSDRKDSPLDRGVFRGGPLCSEWLAL